MEKPENLLFDWNKAYLAIETKPGIECKQEYEYCVNNLMTTVSDVKRNLRHETYQRAGMWAIMLSALDVCEHMRMLI